MNKSLKIFLGVSYLIILFVFLYFIFSYIEVTRLDDFVYYKELQENLERIVSKNIYLDLLIFFLFCVIWVSLLGFGTPLLIISGIIFGKWLGTFISVISISIGATILYSISSFFFKELVQSLFEKKFNKYAGLFTRNEFNYFFAFRLAGGLGIPFGLQNILPVIFKMKRVNYFFASLFGFVPIFFIWNTVGSGLSKYIREAENFSIVNLILSKEIYVPIILFVGMLIISGIIKRKIFDDKSKQIQF